MTEDAKHVHDCTGPDLRCPCGYVLTVPPVYVSIEIGEGRRMLVNESFNCETLDSAIEALEEAIQKLERQQDSEGTA